MSHRRNLKPKDLTVVIRMRRYQARLQAHERRPCVTVGPTITNLMIELELLDPNDLENSQRLGKACETALAMWAEDRAKWLERHFTHKTASCRDRL
jgi:hypothetical protein